MSAPALGQEASEITKKCPIVYQNTQNFAVLMKISVYFDRNRTSFSAHYESVNLPSVPTGCV